ncbi:MAG: LD-carboxypeptidase [Bacteroidota bacterium]
MVTPPFLKPGDTVAIVSTARKINRSELEPALNLLASQGLKAMLGHTIGAAEHQFAGADALRIKDFQAALDNPNIKAIWCARGGYGTVRVIDGLDFSKFIKQPKWIIGFSDITVLHSHIHNFGIETLHAQMPLDIEKKTKAAQDGIFQVLFGRKYAISYATEHSFNRMGSVKAPLVGGNLSVLYSLCGSASGITSEGKILFLEDLDEYLYHIDRMMQNLRRNGMLDALAGLVVGGMTKMHDNTIPFGKSAQEIVRDLVGDCDYPVCYDFPAGHITDNQPLILGREVQLTVAAGTAGIRF